MENLNFTKGDTFSNKVVVHLNMLGPLMLHWVAEEIYSTDIVAIDQGGTARGWRSSRSS